MDKKARIPSIDLTSRMLPAFSKLEKSSVVVPLSGLKKSNNTGSNGTPSDCSSVKDFPSQLKSLNDESLRNS